jgi:hypothetical protein
MANACDWETIDRFQSLAHYEEFHSWINEQVAKGFAAVLPLDPTMAWGNAWEEQWYQCLADREVWRLVGPDPPFRGVFKRLESSPPQPKTTVG